MCLHGVFVLQGKSQVLVSGEASSVASISELLPLCSRYAPLYLFLSVERPDLEWKALGCMPNEGKQQQPGVIRVSYVCMAENFSKDRGHRKPQSTALCAE